MTARELAHDFPLASDLARRTPCELDRDELLAELEHELDKRLRVYPGHIKSGTMKRADAEHHIAVWRALIDDHRQADAAIAAMLGRPAPSLDAPHAFDWPTRIRELRRELAMRRNAYPKWIASPTNPLTQDIAIAKLERLDAVHAHYWLHLFGFTPATEAARAAWCALCERARQKDGWADAIRAGSKEEAAAARHRQDCWRVLELYARRVAGEDIGVDGPLNDTVRIVADEAQRRATEAYAAIPPRGDRDRFEREAVFVQLHHVARWLGRVPDLVDQPQEQRIAA